MQNKEQNESKGNFILSIPITVKNKIDEVFQLKYSPTDLEKIYFLYYKINKLDNLYQINNENHAWMLGFKNGELSNILSQLCQNLIIAKKDVYKVNLKSNTYSVLKPFSKTEPTDYRKNFYVGQCKFPVWVQKYLADGHTVKSKEHSNYIKPVSVKVSKDSQTVSKVVRLEAELRNRDIQIALLQAELTLLRQSKATNDIVPAKEIKATTEPLIPHAEPYIFQHEGSQYIISDWSTFHGESSYSQEELEELFIESRVNTTHDLEDMFYTKTYDRNQNLYNIQLVA